MLSTKIWNRCLVRTFTRSVVRRNVDKTKTPEPTSVTTTTTQQKQERVVGAQDLVQDCVPSMWDKRILILAGRYKNPEDIPPRVSINTMNAVKSQLRIKIATVMMIMILFGCFIITQVGKSKAAQGDTLLQREREREKRLREEGRQALLRESVK